MMRPWEAVGWGTAHPVDGTRPQAACSRSNLSSARQRQGNGPSHASEDASGFTVPNSMRWSARPFEAKTPCTRRGRPSTLAMGSSRSTPSS